MNKPFESRIIACEIMNNAFRKQFDGGFCSNACEPSGRCLDCSRSPQGWVSGFEEKILRGLLPEKKEDL